MNFASFPGTFWSQLRTDYILECDSKFLTLEIAFWQKYQLKIHLLGFSWPFTHIFSGNLKQSGKNVVETLQKVTLWTLS